jgi:hypothetical protein
LCRTFQFAQLRAFDNRGVVDMCRQVQAARSSIQ